MPSEALIEELMETPLFRDSDEYLRNKRLRLINEALGWKEGWQEVDRLEGGLVVGFRKPGRDRERFPHDMTPVLRCGDEECEPWEMREVWGQLCQVGVADWNAFKAILVLVYRNAYLYDHKEEDGRLRYRPPKSAIDKLESRVGGILRYGVLGLLHFLNLLGWNEDMRYNVKDGKPSFDEKNYARGRVNNLLTCIRVPIEVVRFVGRVRDGDVSRDAIDSVLGVIQKLIHTGGLCPPDSKQQLVEWLKPYLTGRPPFQGSLERWMT